MDETSYSDDEAIKFINEEFIPVRVDRDRRPDVDARYNMGGWPTVAILDTEGNLITGATYVDPRTLKPWLRRVIHAWRSAPARGGELKRDRKQGKAVKAPSKGELPAQTQKAEQMPGPKGRPLDRKALEGIYSQTISLVKGAYDPEFGGFGLEPKFPMVEAIELAITEHLRTRDPHSREIFEGSLIRMAEGGLYDHVEGGFFRYSTTRDWSIPHYEKMLEDNGELLGVLVKASSVTGNGKLAETARGVLSYMEKTLYIPEVAAFAGSQDADEEYYSLDADGRKLRSAPLVDRTIFTDWNSKAARNLIEAGWLLGDRRLTRLGMAVLDSMISRSYKPGMGFAHYLQRNEDGNWVPELWGLLADQVAFGRGALAAFQESGDDRWLTLARGLADLCLKAFRARNGGFLEVWQTPPKVGAPHVSDAEAPTLAGEPPQQLETNALVSRFLSELATITGESLYLNAARDALAPWASSFREYGALAAGYGLAAGDLIFPWTVIRIPGDPEDPKRRELVARAHSLFMPRKAVLPYQAEVHEDAVRGMGYEPRNPEALAYICIGERCLPPAKTPQELEERLFDVDPSA